MRPGLRLINQHGQQSCAILHVFFIHYSAFFAILRALGMVIADLIKSRTRLEAEILLLRHQLNLALRLAPPRVQLRGGDRAFMVWVVRLWPSPLEVVRVV